MRHWGAGYGKCARCQTRSRALCGLQPLPDLSERLTGQRHRDRSRLQAPERVLSSAEIEPRACLGRRQTVFLRRAEEVSLEQTSETECGAQGLPKRVGGWRNADLVMSEELHYKMASLEDHMALCRVMAMRQIAELIARGVVFDPDMREAGQAGSQRWVGNSTCVLCP